MTDTLETIAQDVRGCPKCRLCETRTHAVPGEGPHTAEIFFIGEGPGFNEDQQGRPFVGAAGQLLNEMLAHIGIAREHVFITNVVRCRPPANRDPLPDELAACDAYTLRQLAVLKPKVVVTLGRFSMARFFGPNQRITQIHGKTTRWNGTACIAMFHPAAVLRNSSREMRQTYADDFARIPLLLEHERKRLATLGQAAPLQAAAQPPAPRDETPDQLRLF